LGIVYRMGGVFNNRVEWMKKYVDDESALMKWINDSDRVMRNPFNPAYMLLSKVESTWPACLAVKAAEMQDKQKAERFYRKMMEEAQLKAENVSDEQAIEKIAQFAGLDVPRFLSDLRSEKAMKMFEEDREKMKMEQGNFYSLIILNSLTGERRTVQGYTSENYEKTIDDLSGNTLPKRTPLDILEYMGARRDLLVSAREIGEVFKVDDYEAERRLMGLSRTGVLRDVHLHGVGVYWFFPSDLQVPKLTLEQVGLSHVTTTAAVPEVSMLETVVTDAVQRLYTEVAREPGKSFHFPVGREAALFVGYPEDELDKIPGKAVESFAGVGYPHAANVVRRGDTVLDIGSGSGTDMLIAALKTGSKGQVFGLDFTDAMIAKAEENIAKSGFSNVKVIKGNATSIQLPDESVDVVTSNGVLNLVPDKERAFREVFRVLKKGGRIQLADIVVQEDVQRVCGLVPQLWADCIGGAAVEKEYLDMIRKAGFVDVKVIKRLNYFSKSTSESIKRLTTSFGAESVVISARKP